MLNSTILDTALALMFVFTAASLAASAVTEAIAALLKLRSSTLKAGIMDLLNDPDFNGLAADLYAHALISPRAPGMTGVLPAPTAVPQAGAAEAVLAGANTAAGAQLRKNLNTNLPAYIEPKQFANALVEVLSLLPGAGAVPTTAGLLAIVNARVPPATNPQLNQLLNGMIVRASGDLHRVRDDLASWFDHSMDRLSGAYKRKTQLMGFLAALVVCLVTNADALQVAERVWAQPALVEQLKVGGAASSTIEANQDLASTLPLGWSHGFGYGFDRSTKAWARLNLAGWTLAALGWTTTALATLFGAPFWFDGLQRFARLKGAGPSPIERASKTAPSV